MKIIKKIGLVLALATISSSVLAAAPPLSATSNFQSSATLTATCEIKVNNLAFGVVTATTTATSTIELLCSKGIGAYIGIGFGNASYAAGRYMTGSVGNADQLFYNIYKESAYEEVWKIGDGLDSAISDGTKQIITMYGKIGNYESGETDVYVKPDNYTDSVTVYLNY